MNGNTNDKKEPLSAFTPDTPASYNCKQNQKGDRRLRWGEPWSIRAVPRTQSPCYSLATADHRNRTIIILLRVSALKNHTSSLFSRPRCSFGCLGFEESKPAPHEELRETRLTQGWNLAFWKRSRFREIYRISESTDNKSIDQTIIKHRWQLCFTN